MKTLLLLSAFLFDFIIADESLSAGENFLRVQGNCAPGWFQYKDACYMPVMSKRSWPDAEAYCQRNFKGAHLASIHSLNENNYIFNLMGKPTNYKNGEAYWIGAHDTFQEGFYMWTDGTEMDFRRFGRGQPDNAGGAENYIGSWFVENGSITWNDFPYASQYFFPFICKYSTKKC